MTIPSSWNPGLVINAAFYFSVASYYDSAAEDGLHLTVSVGPMIHSSASPVAVPSGADWIITIASTKRHDLTSCLSPDHLPALEFFKYYDPYGLNYYYDRTTAHDTVHLLGCEVPVMTCFPNQNSSIPPCPADFLYFVKKQFQWTSTGWKQIYPR